MYVIVIIFLHAVTVVLYIPVVIHFMLLLQI